MPSLTCFALRALHAQPDLLEGRDVLSWSNVLGCRPGDQALRELPSPGKSGSVFFLSHDDKYVIKTMRRVSLLQLYAADHVWCFVPEALHW